MESTRIENQSSVAVEKNSRGTTYTVKAYGFTADEIKGKLDELMQLAKAKANELEALP